MRRARAAGFVLVLALAGVGCSEPGFDTVEELYAAAGGERWCGGELRVTVAPWVGSCGPDDARVAMAVLPGEGELATTLASADEGLAVLVPRDADALPGWQMRSADLTRLEQAAAALDGEVLSDRDAVERWLEEHP